MKTLPKKNSKIRRSLKDRDGALPAVGRALRILRALAVTDSNGLTFSQLRVAVENSPAPTLSRLLKALIAEGYVAKTQAGSYGRGPQLDVLARCLNVGVSLEDAVADILAQYAKETGESAAFARFSGDTLTLAYKVEVVDGFKLAAHGHVFPVSETEGPTIVVAAHLNEAEFERFVRSPNNQLGSFDLFSRLVEEYRQNGVHIERMPGRPAGPRRACVAVLDAQNQVFGEFHSAIPQAPSDENDARIIRALRTAKTALEERLRSIASSPPG